MTTLDTTFTTLDAAWTTAEAAREAQELADTIQAEENAFNEAKQRRDDEQSLFEEYQAEYNMW